MTDNPEFENVIFGHFNSRRLELTYVSECGRDFKCHMMNCFRLRFHMELVAALQQVSWRNKFLVAGDWTKKAVWGRDSSRV